MTLTSNRLGRQLESISMLNARPLSPRISNFTEPFWLQLSDCVFNVVRCCNCERLHFPPRQQCTACGSNQVSWQPVSGQAKVYSCTTIHAAPAIFANEVPYSVVVLDLEEGVRLVTRWMGKPATCNQSARLVVLRHTDGVLFGAIAEK